MNAHNVVFLSTLKYLKSVASNENDISGQNNVDGQIYTMALGNEENLTFQLKMVSLIFFIVSEINILIKFR